jgi:CDP-diacylglycerol--serine O-phosphatidyltransferase
MNKKVRKPKVELPIVQLLPNLMTIAAICAGLTAIRFGFQGDFSLAVLLILIAGVLDGLDGRVARLLKSESEFGAELDSLADFLNFGVAPAFLMYLWTLQDMRSAGWISVLIFAACSVIRLARFNVGNKSETIVEDKRFFVGVPSPAGALLVMLPMFISFQWPEAPLIPGSLIILYIIFVGLLLISRIPTWSFKTMTIYGDNVKFLFVGFVVVISALLTYPWITLVVVDLVYLAGIIWSWRASKKPEKHTHSHQ